MTLANVDDKYSDTFTSYVLDPESYFEAITSNDFCVTQKDQENSIYCTIAHDTKELTEART